MSIDGGDINVDNKEDQGCVFVFTIVLEYAETAVITHDSNIFTSDDSPRRKKILVVEDNLANRDLARMILEGDGHQVTEAETGVEALDYLSRDEFDVILMDIQMPQMDGLVTTRIIRCLERGEEVRQEYDYSVDEKLKEKLFGHHLPIIALTAHAMSGDREKCLAAGVDTYLTKPFIPEQVLSVLREI